MSDEQRDNRIVRFPKLLREDVVDGSAVEQRLRENPAPPADGHVLPFREQPASTDVPAGLCESCKHATRVPSSKGSIFVRCDLSLSDARFPRYPRLPKVQCSGFVANDSDAAQSK